MTPAQILLTITLFLGQAENCTKPRIIYSSELISSVCQPYAIQGNRALACYHHSTNWIILPSYCQHSSCERLLKHELGRAVYSQCLNIKTLTDEQLEELEAL